MARSIDTRTPKDFAELLDIIEEFQSNSKSSWYRGISDIKYRMIPSLFRHHSRNSIDDISLLEAELTTRFVQRSLPFLQRPLTNEWDKLFLMQHYGIPTRLLDWSENPFVAIYFALSSASKSKKSDAAIWMCDPISWNRAALDHISFQGEVLDESSEVLRSYIPGTNASQMPMMPIMIYGTYNSPRIVAQRGGFSLFGQGTRPMEEVVKDDRFPSGTLSKIKVAHDSIEPIRSSLFRKGFTESVVFPDLDGLAREIRRAFGF